MSSDTYINCRVDGGNSQTLTIKDIFDLFDNGSSIGVLSMVGKKEIDYASVNKVWKSGKKMTYVLKTRDSQIRLTKEHLVYIPKDKTYKSVMDITSEDSILVLKGKKLIIQKLMSDPEKYKVEEVYDIEVPDTENFIGNNVVSHNSRWFRYLYKSS
jgi:intein/homing endonuclease